MADDQPPELQVRRATLADLDTLVEFNAALALETECKTLDPQRLRAGVAELLNDDGRGSYFVAEESGRVVGQLLITTEWSDWRNGYFWWIQSVYIAPGFRRRGVYRSLHNHVIAESRVQGGVCGLRLYVHQDNSVAQRVYAGMDMGESPYQMWEAEFPP